jgi:hypothetical protein
MRGVDRLASGNDLKYRFWLMELATAFRTDLQMEPEKAEDLARFVLSLGIPPGEQEQVLEMGLLQIPEWRLITPQILAAVRPVRLRFPDEPDKRGSPAGPQLLERPEMPEERAAAMALPSDDEALLAEVDRRMRALALLRSVGPRLEGSWRNLRHLRMAVAGEADDSFRLPLLLAEWLQVHADWQGLINQYQSARSAVRDSEWLIKFLRDPGEQEQG